MAPKNPTWTLALTLALAVACGPAGNAPTVSEPIPGTSPGGSLGEPATQVGDPGTQTCAEADVVAGSEDEVFALDVLEGAMQVTTLAGTWFDGRAVDVTLDPLHDSSPIRVREDCALEAAVTVTVASADGAINAAFDANVSFADNGELSLAQAVDSHVGSLTGEQVQGSPCPATERWTLRANFHRDGYWWGSVDHECDTYRSAGGLTGTTTAPPADDTGDSGLEAGGPTQRIDVVEF